MNRVTFESEQHQYANSVSSRLSRQQSGLTRWMITRGLAKNARQASFILIGVSVLLLIVTVWLLRNGGDASRYGNYDEMKALYPAEFSS